MPYWNASLLFSWSSSVILWWHFYKMVYGMPLLKSKSATLKSDFSDLAGFRCGIRDRAKSVHRLYMCKDDLIVSLGPWLLQQKLRSSKFVYFLIDTPFKCNDLPVIILKKEDNIFAKICLKFTYSP